MITFVDVLHSWVVPSLGVKSNVVLGCLNQTSIFIKREGVYYGQCSEICGTNHAFMHAPEYIGRLLSLLWLNHTFLNKANLGASYPKSYHGSREGAFCHPRGHSIQSKFEKLDICTRT
jgi:hypothetical protein